ncbi:hypothetical protein BLA60_20155 [Actinophytocola xinjiangensis]|uniref:PPE family protein n=1 Tax=Actinophytocola xinjiangensis TaxID=485602 RepID=A0A7Z0WKI2_9PSEU|nr:hypothetical protein [Actinophytocola xinjiangensis]OLF09471.1 hypothetical protein BLA60_20155 [Actinophytocola xinjiangensis]
MDGDYGLSDLRFEGYSNEDLARQVDGLRDGGSGTESLNNAVRALIGLADGLSDTDTVLREQLREIGVSWEGTASDDGFLATQSASIYAEDATDPVRESADSVNEQGDVFTSTRNSAPDSGTLRGPSEENIGDRVAGFFGHTTDHAKDVRATNQARDQAIDGLNGYQSGSSAAIGRAGGLPVPPGMNLVAQPAEAELGVTGASGLESGPAVGPAGQPGSGPGAGPNPTLPGGPNNPLPTSGGTPPVGGPPGQQFTSTNPVNPSLPSGPSVGQNLLRPLNPVLMGDAALMTAGGGGAGTGAGPGDRTVRGGLNPASGKGVTPGRAVTIGAVPDDEARAARNAEKFGARTGRPGSSLMQPAAPGGRADGEDDKEHVRRYGIDSGDVFEDQRVVAPESIGDEPDDH